MWQHVTTVTTVLRPCSSLHGLWPFGHWAGTTLSSSERSAQVPRSRLERILKAFRKHRKLGRCNVLQRTKLFDAGFSVAGRDAVWNPKGFHNLSYVSAKCPQCVQDAFPKTLSLHWGRLSSHCVYSAVRRRLNSKNYWTQRLQSLWSSLISLRFCLFLSFSFSCHCFGKLSWSCFQDFQSAEVHMQRRVHPLSPLLVSSCVQNLLDSNYT